jgi:hypothetical protein
MRARRVPAAAVALVLLAFALLVANTRPFTSGADAVTAIALAAMAIGIGFRWPLHTTDLRPLRPARGHPLLPWLLLFAAAAVWEAYEYVAPGARSIHPTFSSIETAADRYYSLKVLVVLGWVALGALILRRGQGARA